MFRSMPHISDNIGATIDKCRTGTLPNNTRLHMMGLVHHTQCPICPMEDSIGHIMGYCSHADMKKQHIARHDKAMRLLISSLMKGKQGGNYIIADVGQAERARST